MYCSWGQGTSQIPTQQYRVYKAADGQSLPYEICVCLSILSATVTCCYRSMLGCAAHVNTAFCQWILTLPIVCGAPLSPQSQTSNSWRTHVKGVWQFGSDAETRVRPNSISRDWVKERAKKKTVTEVENWRAVAETNEWKCCHQVLFQVRLYLRTVFLSPDEEC